MPSLRALGLISGAITLVAIACGSAATPADTPLPTPSTAPRVSTAAPTAQPAQSPTPAPPEATATPRVVSPTPTGLSGPFVDVEPTGLVERDPDFEQELSTARFSTAGWRTDFSYHSVPFRDFLSGGPPRDGIRPIDRPAFVAVGQADEWLSDMEPVISFELNGDRSAYPLLVIFWH